MSDAARYWREIPQRYRMEAARCKGCSKVWFPPRIICAECRGREFETVKLADEGKILAYTVIRVAPSGFGDDVPYAVAVVELADGVRITCQVVDCDPEELEVGFPVKIEFRKVTQDGEAGVIYYGYKGVPASY